MEARIYGSERSGGSERFQDRIKEPDIDKELRSLLVDKIKTETRSHEETLVYLRDQANALVSGTAHDQSIKKRLGKIQTLMNEGVKSLALLNERIEEAERGFRVLRKELLTEVKKEWINLPATAPDKKRLAIIPSDMGEVTKKRKTSNGAKNKAKNKSKKKRGVPIKRNVYSAGLNLGGPPSESAMQQAFPKRKKANQKREPGAPQPSTKPLPAPI